MSTTLDHPDSAYDRLDELKRFDDSKIGVKGLVDTGISAIPRFFIHRTPAPPSHPTSKPRASIPIIDFSSPRSTIVDQVRLAASSLGFFQIINHNVPTQTINTLLNSVSSFNELPVHEKARYYTRDLTHGSAFSTNFDLYNSKAASWRDTLQLRLAPNPPDWDHVPDTCKEAIKEWDKEAVKLGEELIELLCEGLGLRGDRLLKDMSCLDARVLAGHYYPYCPQPELTAGLTSHTDPGVITVLVQNEVPGLQVKVGEDWVGVEPVEGAVVINIGDIMQILSNDRYKSVEHRVMANPFQEPRVSVAIFFNPGQRNIPFEPLPELVSAEKPAHYRRFMFEEYMKRFFSKELDGKTLTNYYRI